MLRITVEQQLRLWEKLSEEVSLIPLQGKRPIELNWQQWCYKKRPFNPDDFRGRNAGLACGPASNSLFLDIDDVALFVATCKAKGWTIPKTFQVTTGSDKPHYRFCYPNNGKSYGNKSFKKWGFDIRGAGGQVVTIGSIHPDTDKPYVMADDCPVAPAPQWLLDLYEDPPKQAHPQPGASLWSGDIDSLPIKPETKELIRNGIPKPYRSEAMMTVLNALVWSNLSDSDIFSIFESYPIGEKYHGKGQAKEKWLQREIEKARDYVTDRAEPRHTDFVDNAPSQAGGDEATGERAAIQAESRNAEKKAKKGPVSISVSDLLQTEFEHKTPIIAEGILPPQAGMILAGEGGVGKSLIILEWAIRLVMGWNILDVGVPTARIIKIFQAENPLGQVQYRLKRILQGFQITGLPNQIFFSNPKARYDLARVASLKRLKDEILEFGADVFILDPLSSFHKVNENDNIAVRAILDNVTSISRETGAAAIIIHHFGKPVDGRDNSYRTRGAMSIRDWADTLISITHRRHENKILRQIDFIKIRNGPTRKSVLVERDQNFIHEIVEEDVIVPRSKVKEILELRFDGRADKQLDLIKVIMNECECSHRTAQRAIHRAADMKVIIPFEGERKAKGYAVL